MSVYHFAPSPQKIHFLKILWFWQNQEMGEHNESTYLSAPLTFLDRSSENPSSEELKRKAGTEERRKTAVIYSSH